MENEDEIILIDKEIKGPKTLKASTRAIKRICITFLERAYGESSKIFAKRILRKKNESELFKEVIERYGLPDRGIETYSYIVYDADGKPEVIDRSVSIYGYSSSLVVQVKKSPETKPFLRVHVEAPAELRESVRKLLEEFDSTFGELSLSIRERIHQLEDELREKYISNDELAVEEIAEELLTLDPKNPYGYLYLGLLRFSQGRMEEARYNIERAWKKKKDPLIGRYFGIILARLGEYKDAVNILEHVYSQRPHDAMLAAYLGLSYVMIGKKEKAKTILDSILHDPDAFVEEEESLEDALALAKEALEKAWLE